MKNPSNPLDRRQLLVAGLSALGGMALATEAGARVRFCLPRDREGASPAGRTLVLLQLSGGNDGLSLVVPWADDAYHKVRPTIRIGEKDVLKLDDYRGLHPELKKLRALWDRGQLGIVEGCSYPKPNRSHFQSMEIWHTADLGGRNSGDGWIGRLCGAAFDKEASPELVVHVGAAEPYSLHSTRHPAIVFQTPHSYKWVAPDQDDRDLYRKSGEAEGKEANPVLQRLRGVLGDANESSLRIRRAVADYTPGVNYPADELGEVLKVAAALIHARVGSRVISVELGGFDSHNNQRQQHDERMRRLDAGLGAFLNDLASSSAGGEVLVVCFSEFGRRVKENGSRGTDHGVAGPMLVCGTSVQGGLYGKHPSLTELVDGDLAMTTDFRSVYATVIERWFGVEPTRVLDASYPALGFLKA